MIEESSLVPRLSARGGGEREPGTHRSRMRLIGASLSEPHINGTAMRAIYIIPSEARL